MAHTGPTFYLLDAADADVREIWRYTTATWGEAQAARYVDALFDACETLGRYPNLGHKIEELPSKLHVYRYAHHRIIYYVDGDLVVVTAILHERQDILANLAGRI